MIGILTINKRWAAAFPLLFLLSLFACVVIPGTADSNYRNNRIIWEFFLNLPYFTNFVIIFANIVKRDIAWAFK